MTVLLDGSTLTLESIAAIAHDGARVALSPDAIARVRASRAVVEHHAGAGRAVYGINTGFGALADVAIAPDQLAQLQLNLIRSHAAGVGEPLPTPAVRALTALRANVLAKGYSGIRLETLELLIALVNAGIHPRVPSRGSVGASGDLAPLAHLALVLVGEGEARQGVAKHIPDVVSGADALTRAGLRPVTLAAKEGLALINGTQASTATLALAVAAAERLARVADIAAALSIDALRGSMHPFEARIHDARQAETHVKTIKSLGCEAQIHQHDGHFDVTYRCLKWRQMNLKSHEAAHQWEAWLKKAGFETKHQH